MTARALLLVFCAAAGAWGGTIDGPVRRQLAELKRVCDAGLVAPAVCVEKQRALLGLPADPAPAAAVPVPAPAPGPTAASAPSPAATVASRLGVRLALPPGWTAVDQAAVAQGFAMLQERLADQPAAAAFVERVRRQQGSGGAELFAHGRDVLQVTGTPAGPPRDATGVARLCAALPRPATGGEAPATCEARRVGGHAAVFVEQPGVVPGTRAMQYWVALPAGGVRLVLTCRAADAEARRAELDAIVAALDGA